jgi:hypothetical protein
VPSSTTGAVSSADVSDSSVAVASAAPRRGRRHAGRGRALGGERLGRLAGGAGRGGARGDLRAPGALGLADGRLADRQGLDELDDRHGRVVALAVAELEDARVATGPVDVARADLGEQRVHDALVVQALEHLATGVQVTALAEGDEVLGVRAQALGLGLRRGDPAVLEQLRRQVAQHEPLVRRAAAHARTLVGGGHVLLFSGAGAGAPWGRVGGRRGPAFSVGC